MKRTGIIKRVSLKLAFLMLITLSIFTAAFALEGDVTELTGGPDGRIHLNVNSNEIIGFSPVTADAGWKFSSPTAVPVTGDDPFRFKLSLGKDIINGEIKAAEKDGKVDLVWTFTCANDISFNSLCLNSDLSIASIASGTWVSDTKSGSFPRGFGAQGLGGGETKSLSITYPDGRNVKLTFPVLTYVGMQDNRQWGGQSFSLRIGKGFGKMAANEVYTLAMSIAVPEGMKYLRDMPVLLAANDDWIPLKTELDIVPGSALDLSECNFTYGPCGSKGRVITTPEGHFAFADDPKTPRRFYGVNLCFSAQFLPKDKVDILLDRLVRLGYNSVRIHHYEFGLTKPEWKTGFDWDPVKIDQLDYLIAGCAKRGLWLTTDLYVSRPVSGKQINMSSDRIDPDRYKNLIPVYEPAFQDWMIFSRKLLDHVNPYTGNRVAEEPAMAWLSMINEGPVAHNGWEWTVAWNSWLAKKYPNRDDMDLALGDLADTEDPAANSVAFPANMKSGTRRARVCQVFHAEIEKAMIERMRKFLRDDLKCPAMITDLNNAGPASVPMQAARNEFDYVDEHFYVDHPSFLINQWKLPSRTPNSNPIKEGAPGCLTNASVRLWGKPFTISEYNYSGPGRFRGVGGILTSAMAALQDWDILWRFAYSHNDKDNFEPSPIDYFNLAKDPLNQAADRTALFLFMRRDIKTAPNRIAVVMPKETLRTPPSKLGVGGIESAAWITRIGTAVVDDAKQVPADAIAIPFKSANDRDAVAAIMRDSKKLPEQQADGVVRSETGDIAIDKKRGVLTIDTLCSAGGYADAGQKINAVRAGVKVDGLTIGATVFVNSLDGKPIKSARRLLVTHLTDLQNTGISYAESARQTLLAWGNLPHLVRNGDATVRVTLTDPASYTVWALSTSGRRVEKVESKIEAGELVFTATVKGAEGARMLYEVTK